jgi:hypothetical protein
MNTARIDSDEGVALGVESAWPAFIDGAIPAVAVLSASAQGDGERLGPSSPSIPNTA